MYARRLALPTPPKRSFFLWGPRQTGKTSLLEALYPNEPFISLLKNEELIAFRSRPQALRERVKALKSKFVIIDEIQKVPELLNEIHYLIEKERIIFGLCGSSARGLKRAHGNLLGGRAIRHELFPLTSAELGADFDLVQALNRGLLPAIYLDKDYAALLRSYCANYLKEEIFDEGLVRRLQPFSQFLELAALSDAEVLNYTTFARDVGVSSPAIKSYFEILSDTLIGSFLPAYAKRPKRKTVLQPKFYFFDVGVVNHLARRGELRPRSELFGKAMENWVHHELRAYLSYAELNVGLSFWRLHQGAEVDFVIGEMQTAIEVKASENIHRDHLVGLRELKKDFPKVGGRYVVSLEPHSRVLDDGITVLSAGDFARRLWRGELF